MGLVEVEILWNELADSPVSSFTSERNEFQFKRLTPLLQFQDLTHKVVVAQSAMAIKTMCISTLIPPVSWQLFSVFSVTKSWKKHTKKALVSSLSLSEIKMRVPKPQTDSFEAC